MPSKESCRRAISQSSSHFSSDGSCKPVIDFTGEPFFKKSRFWQGISGLEKLSNNFGVGHKMSQVYRKCRKCLHGNANKRLCLGLHSPSRPFYRKFQNNIHIVQSSVSSWVQIAKLPSDQQKLKPLIFHFINTYSKHSVLMPTQQISQNQSLNASK